MYRERISSTRKNDDVVEIHSLLQYDNAIISACIYFDRVRTSEAPIENLIKDTFRLQTLYFDRLIMTLLQKRISHKSYKVLQQASEIIKNSKSEIISRFTDPSLQRYLTVFPDDVSILLTAQRLLELDKDVDIAKKNPNYLGNINQRKYYMIPQKKDGVFEEAIALFPDREKLMGYSIMHVEEGTNSLITLYLKDKHNELVKIDIDTGNSEHNKVNEFRNNKRILIALEGDIAGHAIRALETTRGLRKLGYFPIVYGNGYYMSSFDEANIPYQSLYTTQHNEERDRVIKKLKGKGSIFLWDYNTLRERSAQVRPILQAQMDQGIDLYFSDMAFISDIVVDHLQQETGTTFPCVTQTHDISLSPQRILRTIKVKGFPLGQILHTIQHSGFARRIDPHGIRFAATHFLFNELADVVMGVPLASYDYINSAKHHKRRIKFTDYKYGRDGTLISGINLKSEQDNTYQIGLLSERINNTEEAWEKAIPSNKVLILNMQGSMYNSDTWNAVVHATMNLQNIFSIHATGRKEDSAKILTIKDSLEASGLCIGYAPGYRLARKAQIVVNHGGFGTISQWLTATADRLMDESIQLQELIEEGDYTRMKGFVTNSKGCSRSLSICNLFDQENNALKINELGGNNVCMVVTADQVLHSPQPEDFIKQQITKLLESPVDSKELKFWIDTVKSIAQMSPSIHSALILERILWNSKIAKS